MERIYSTEKLIFFKENGDLKRLKKNILKKLIGGERRLKLNKDKSSFRYHEISFFAGPEYCEQ